MKKIGIITLVMLAAGCFRLDDNLFNPREIDAYLFGEYDGYQEFSNEGQYAIADSMVTLLTLDSKAPEEASGTLIYAAYVGDISRIATDTVILYCHGNGAHMDAYWPRIELLANIGGLHRYGVMLFDYRGYGLSEGSPSEAGMYADADACLQWLAANGLTGDRLVMYGYSMGTAPACELTANPRTLTPGWLMHESPFASAAVMVQDAATLNMPGTYYTNLKIDNADEIRKVQQPYLLFHGTDDTYLRISTHGEVVYKNYAGQRGQFYRVEGAEHGTIPPTFGRAEYMAAILAFLRGG